jgi:hypothetical protein
MKCVLKKCSEYNTCLKKKNPFAENKICKGYIEYINQDLSTNKGTQFEIPFSAIGFEVQMVSDDIKNNIFNNSNKSLKELIIQMFFFDKEKPKYIKDKLDCNISYVYEIIRECENKLLENNKKIIIKKMKK